MKTIFQVLLVLVAGIGDIPAEPPPRFDAQSAWQYLVKQVAFGPRNPGSPGHRQCLQFLKTELQKFADQVIEQPFMHYDAYRGKTLVMTNLIARFRPNVEPRILLCAHWDTRPFADRDPNPANRQTPIPGANDGASGVAVLLEVARILKQQPPPIGVDIVLFDGEDYGREGHLEEYFLGSRYFVQNNDRYFPAFAILLDMVGDANLQLPREGFSVMYAPEVVDRVWRIAREMGYSQFEDRIGLQVNDDHVILNEGGIPTINIIDFQYPDASHRFWHTLQDVPENCSPESLKVVGDVLLKLIYEEPL
ncbi:MAG: M28 family peptidase [Calditrichaeota bacterium]|nr:M28 family peptidase [Calditrichota bacterium]